MRGGSVDPFQPIQSSFIRSFIHPHAMKECPKYLFLRMQDFFQVPLFYVEIGWICCFWRLVGWFQVILLSFCDEKRQQNLKFVSYETDYHVLNLVLTTEKCKVKALGWVHSQNKRLMMRQQQLSLAPWFGNVPPTLMGFTHHIAPGIKLL